MRKFLGWFFTVWALAVITVVSVAGFRGGLSRRPPLEFFDDMDRQPKLRPQTRTTFAAWADGQSSRLPVAGTVARHSAWEANERNTGKKPDGAFVENLPVAVNAELVRRGQERYGIYCKPCHGAAGDGKGVTSKFGMANTASLFQERLVKAPDGELFNTLSYGKSTMMGYAGQIPVEDRWAIVAYVRALQLARYGTKDDVPADRLSTLK